MENLRYFKFLALFVIRYVLGHFSHNARYSVIRYPNTVYNLSRLSPFVSLSGSPRLWTKEPIYNLSLSYRGMLNPLSGNLESFIIAPRIPLMTSSWLVQAA